MSARAALGGLFERGDALLQGVEFGRRNSGSRSLGRVLQAGAQLRHRLDGGIGAFARLRHAGGNVVAAAIERGERDAERLHGAIGGGQALRHAGIAGRQFLDRLFDLAHALAQRVDRFGICLALWVGRRLVAHRQQAGQPEREQNQRHGRRANETGGKRRHADSAANPGLGLIGLRRRAMPPRAAAFR